MGSDTPDSMGNVTQIDDERIKNHLDRGRARDRTGIANANVRTVKCRLRLVVLYRNLREMRYRCFGASPILQMTNHLAS
jgi:hypothetical protein